MEEASRVITLCCAADGWQQLDGIGMQQQQQQQSSRQRNLAAAGWPSHSSSAQLVQVAVGVAGQQQGSSDE